MGNVRYQIVDGNILTIYKVVFFRYELLHPAWAQPLRSEMIIWKESDAYKFVVNNAVGVPVWHSQKDIITDSIKCACVAEMEEKKLSEYYLKFDKQYN